MPEWTADTIDRLRNLWSLGHATSAIGRELGVSKNAVVGKAHRLKLPPRPSPIRIGHRVGSDVDRSPSRAGRPVGLPALARKTAVVFAPLTVTASPKLAVAEVTPRPARTTTLGTHQCSWPIGEPGTAAFHFCAQHAEAGRPYCPQHCEIAYRARRPRATQGGASLDREVAA
jgi:GcrA cell cycle regulator